MTTIGDLLGSEADNLSQSRISVGDVHLLDLDQSNGITPKNGDTSRDKFFVVLGFDEDGNVIGGLVINSKINYNLPSAITDYQLPITKEQCKFLHHNSFVNCSKIIVAHKSKFNQHTYRGEIANTDLLAQIISTVKESPTINRKQLERFGLI